MHVAAELSYAEVARELLRCPLAGNVPPLPGLGDEAKTRPVKTFIVNPTSDTPATVALSTTVTLFRNRYVAFRTAPIRGDPVKRTPPLS